MGNALWRSNRRPGPLLGDSFCNIYSLELMGRASQQDLPSNEPSAGRSAVDCIPHERPMFFRTTRILGRVRGRDSGWRNEESLVRRMQSTG